MVKRVGGLFQTIQQEKVVRFHVTIRNVAEQLSNEKILRGFRGIARACTITKTFQYQPKLTLNIE